MKRVTRASALALIAAPFLWVSSVRAVDVWTVGVDNTRQGWNKFETVLKPANVPELKKIREFVVDEKIDVSPLVVGNKLYVFTMTNTVYVFDVNTGAELAKRQLAAPFDPCAQPGQMDMWCVYHNWGITATPVIDVATNTLYVTTFGKAGRRQPATRIATTCCGYSTRAPSPTRSRRCSLRELPTTAAAGSRTASRRRTRRCARAWGC